MIFSTTGDTKEPSWNWLSVERTTKISVIKLDLSHQHAVEGTHRKRTQCCFRLAPSESDKIPPEAD